ncbi:MAG: hypothetical protein U1E27_03350, partial [Kiritimatiellia bacterium]|nr:hypothetical protein [Kiritimatiellia bacterium]
MIKFKHTSRRVLLRQTGGLLLAAGLLTGCRSLTPAPMATEPPPDLSAPKPAEPSPAKSLVYVSVTAQPELPLQPWNKS